jgi:hypothetical protein
MEWPEWWSWEVELTPHVEKRMQDRGFTEVDLRAMLHVSLGFRADVVPDRWVIDCSFHGRAWEVIVEPDHDGRRLVVVTAYAGG